MKKIVVLLIISTLLIVTINAQETLEPFNQTVEKTYTSRLSGDWDAIELIPISGKQHAIDELKNYNSDTKGDTNRG